MSNTNDGLVSETGPFTVPFESTDAKQLGLTGGKGTNLARLVEAGFPVPQGFCVTTVAYRSLVDTPELQAAIDSLDTLEPENTGEIAEVSAEIRAKIQRRRLPDDIRQTVVDALEEMDADTYAIRSSATAEDLPTASFAGQHESYLSVEGTTAVLERVRDCMASLFTDRAVSYRLQNGVTHDDVAMAIVVQAMVDPDVAGVLFTADPVSQNRHVASIDANYGLGDTVVAGDVSPDNARVDRRTGEVIAYEVGGKRHALRGKAKGGGTETVEISPEDRNAQALSEDDLRSLVELGDRVEELLGGPQDIEWALVDDEFVLLQSRPITSLFPLPSLTPDDDELHVYFSIGHQQAMAEALPPLVVDWMRGFPSDVVALFRSQDTKNPLLVDAGHRVYVDLTPLLRNDRTQRVVLRVLNSISEPAADALEAFLERRQESIPRDSKIDQLRKVGNVVRRALPAVMTAAPTLLVRFARPFVDGPPDPERVRRVVESNGEQVAERISRQPSKVARVRMIFEEVGLGTLAAKIGSQSMPLAAAGAVAGALLGRLYPDATDELDALGKGFDDEIATQINQRIGELTDIARRHPDVATTLEDATSLSEVEQVDGGEEFVAAFQAFLDDFGHRASSEMDLSRPRWRDDPEVLFRTIRSGLRGSATGSHGEHLERLKADAEVAAAELEARAGQGILGPVKKPVVRRLIEVYRGGIQLREHHKHGAAQYLATVHDVLSEAGESLTADGRLDRPDDVWYLHEEELLSILEGEGPIDVAVDERRRTHDRYASMTAPPLLTSEGETPTATGNTDVPENALVGTPVSSGVVEGPARVVRDPTEESLEKGEILVAPSTDVGWTPLFQNAVGLVMEVGGQMTHGALVAREYGIPAVVSVSNATTEIQTGEQVRIDGARGTVELLDRRDKSTPNAESQDGTEDET